jgi:DNA-binding HxlR family transcriptional regulator
MTAQVAGLKEIARADASPAQARELLLSIFGQPTPDVLSDTYLALRSWVWKALDQRRRDQDLIAWRDILNTTAALMTKNGQPLLGERIGALAELVAESISVAEAFGAIEATRRQHVGDILCFLAAQGGRVHRAALGEHLGLAQANLTRVLNMMSVAGLVERSSFGKEAIFALTRAGVDAARTTARERNRGAA